MYTQCPHCQTCFRIAEAHLKAAKGKVRCGSCQDIFDATGHLYTKLPATPENRLPPANDIIITPEDLKRVDHQHIDLSATPIDGSASIPTEQSGQPDQSAFMESTVGENTHYNNLDDMEPVQLPGDMGDLHLSDSFISFAGEDKRKIAADKNEAPPAPNPYEDTEAKEVPATTEETNAIQDLYTIADELLHTNKSTDIDTGKSEIDKHIDELVSFTEGRDMNTDLSKPDKNATDGSEYDDPDDIEELKSFNPSISTKPPVANSDIEDLIASLDAKPENLLTADGPGDKSPKHIDSSINFNAIDLAIEPLTSERPSVDEQSLGVKDPQPHLAFNHESETKSAQEPVTDPGDFDKKREDINPVFKQSADDAFDDQPDSNLESDITDNTALEAEDDLPTSPEERIPLLLRRSLEKMEIPQRPLVQTIGMVVIILVLLGGLATQFVLFRSVKLARALPSLAPVLTRLCDSLPCRYSGPVDVSQISLLNRDVRSHPTQKSALLISAAFVNQADFDQPYPNILVTLSDLSGHIVANRRFTPQEYLDTMYNRFLLMESGTPVRITLPVLDPGDDAINFEFTFL